MDQTAKNLILKKAQSHLREIREAITRRKIYLRGMIEKSRNDIKKMSSFDKQIQMKVLGFQEQSLKEADSLGSSPYFAEFKSEFDRYNNAHVLSMREAQGVEFDIVCVVGADRDDFFSSDADEEKKRINKDLLYVALTRAISELHVLGERGLAGGLFGGIH